MHNHTKKQQMLPTSKKKQEHPTQKKQCAIKLNTTKNTKLAMSL